MSQIAGIDVGGTFTDLILVDSVSGAVKLAKVPTTVHNQAFGVLAALESAGVSASALDAIIHGTTTTTNAMLERKVARVGLITTRGFRDVIELGRRTRPKPYGMKGSFTPLIARESRLEVDERLSAEGEVLVPLDEAQVKEAATTLLAQGCEAVVIHFLHSYMDASHERRAAEIVRALWPTPYVTAGHSVISEYREYERGVTAAVNACVQPVLSRYIERLQGELTKQGFARELLVMQGNGGTVAAALVAEAAVNTVMSGPASGVIAAAVTGVASDMRNLITYDMGGTSSDVALIRDGTPEISAELELEYAMPIHVPMVDVHTIGAGGGSLASVDASGMLKVGPESAGSTPGPICYARGGTRPTITDANLLLGRLSTKRLFAVEKPVTLETVREHMQREVGTPLDLSAEEAAAAVIRVANDKMAGAVRMVSLSRGHDPRDFALFAFGGAGPLHACALAKELGIPKVLIPARPGLTNALGCTVAHLRHDFVRTVNRRLHEIEAGLIESALNAQAAEGRALIAREAVAVERIETRYRADLQFEGQSHVLTVDVPDAAISNAALADAFAQAYQLRFGVALEAIRPVLVNLHTAVIGVRTPVDLKAIAARAPRANLEAARIEVRPVWFAGTGFTNTPVYQREWLPDDAKFQGPAIIEQLDCTTVIEPEDAVWLDFLGNLIVTVKGF